MRIRHVFSTERDDAGLPLARRAVPRLVTLARMTRIVRVQRTGGPEVLEFGEVDVPPPAPGEVQLRHTALGLNFIDVYYRSGLYPAALPMTPGQEGAGVITAVGEGVVGFSVDQRVAYAGALGAYADVRNLSAERLVHLPDFIDIVINAGDDRNPLGATIGESLPNWGPVANEGRGRTVAMVNLYLDPDSIAARRGFGVRESAHRSISERPRVSVRPSR